MSTLGELRAALELALDWYEPKHDGVVPRWVVLARAALVAEGQGDAPLTAEHIDRAFEEASPLIMKKGAFSRKMAELLNADLAALHKEELQARFTRALANNNILEQMILANWKAGSNPTTSININGLINDLVDLLGEAAWHKEGAGGARLTAEQVCKMVADSQRMDCTGAFIVDEEELVKRLNAALSPAGRAEQAAKDGEK